MYGKEAAGQSQQAIGGIRGATLSDMERSLNFGLPSPVEVREIEREHSDLMREVESLNAAVNYMVQRLAPVIRQVPATAQMEKAVPTPSCYSELGTAIREAAERVRSSVARLRETTESLAV
jgi:hypothetical protein